MHVTTHTSDLVVNLRKAMDSGAIQRMGTGLGARWMYSEVARERPKSHTFTNPLSPNRTLRHARSQWITFWLARNSWEVFEEQNQ